MNLTEIAFEAPVAPSMNEDEDDYSGPKYKFYESQKILGKLYRAIDEYKIEELGVQHGIGAYRGPFGEA